MVGERLTDGVRIGQLLASEIAGNEGRLRNLAVADADPDVEPTPTARSRTGWFAAAREAGRTAMKSRRRVRKARGTSSPRPMFSRTGSGSNLSRGRGEVMGSGLPAVAADAAESAGLRVRPKAVRPPRTLVFVEDGAQVKRVLSVFEAVVAATGKSE